MPPRRLPPLLALRAFEAAGRHLSFGRAADELSVSQSAISHHVRRLEDELGVSLFVRLTRRIELTAEGAQLLAVARQAFDLLADGTRALRQSRQPRLRVSLLPSFAANWLVPRLPRFHAAHPDIEIVLEPTLQLAEVGRGGVDLAIRYGVGGWPGVAPRRLMGERLTPVCSPELLARRPLRQPADLAGQPLLTSHSREPREWTAWARLAGIALDLGRSRMLTDYNIVLQAALGGQGVAMGRRLLLAEPLGAGRLVEPFPSLVVEGELAYWLLTAPGQPDPALIRFMDWLLAEGAAAEAALAA